MAITDPYQIDEKIIKEIEKDPIQASTPENLQQALQKRLDAIYSNRDNSVDSQHYILCKIGNSQSLLKVDTSQRPFQIWHYNLSHRPATDKLRDTIMQFLSKWGGDAAECFVDVSGAENRLTHNPEVIPGGIDQSPRHAIWEIEKAIVKTQKPIAAPLLEEPTSNRNKRLLGLLGLFGGKKKEIEQPSPAKQSVTRRK